MLVVEVRGLTKRFGEVLAVDQLSFAVEAGRVTGFLGPNGAGKTTTLRMLLGLVRPTAGEALINGVPYRQLPRPMSVVGAVLDASGFHPGRTARNHLRSIAIAGGLARSRVDEVLDWVGLHDAGDRRVGGFSMGMRQRLDVAQAVLGDPLILVLDEPALGLDPQGIAWLRSFLRRFASEGKAVLISSHILAEAAQTVDDVVIISGGCLAAQGRLEALLRGARTTVRVRCTEPARLMSVLQDTGLIARAEPAGMVVVYGAAPGTLASVMADHHIEVLEMNSSSESLEHLFLALTGDARSPAPASLVRPPSVPQTPPGPGRQST